MKKFADDNYIPVLCELGSESCPPCTDFDNRVFSQSSFQELVKSMGILLCRIKSSTMGVAGGQDYFLAHEWMHEYSSESGQIGYLPYVMPILMFYWYRKDGATDGTSYVPAAMYEYAHYNSHQSQTSEFCPWLSSYDDVVDWLSSIWEPFAESYTVDSKFKLPDIQFVQSYPYYKRYDNQADDMYGRYFPVNVLRPAKDYEQFNVSILNAMGSRS